MTRLALVLGLVPLVACGGRAIAENAPDGGSGSDAGACVTIDVATYDRSCQQASDCISISAGTFCDGQCGCGGATINADGEGRYESQLASITQGDCFCPEEGTPECIGNVCTICTGGANDPPSCGDSITPPDAGECVYIDLANYDTGCRYDTDCISVTTGEICTGSCLCGGSAINTIGEEQYNIAIQSVGPAECPCPFGGPTRCIQSVCTVCGFGPNQPPGCEAIDAGAGGN